jgi:calnexin
MQDGEWESPTVPNPICTTGCGKWDPPTIKNPLYKGPWAAPLIPNPTFIGPWFPKKVPNPAYFTDPNPVASLAPITALAVEVWTVTAAILFDNFVLSHNSASVDPFTRATFAKKVEAERAVGKKEEEMAASKERERMLNTGEWGAFFVLKWAQVSDFFVNFMVYFVQEDPLHMVAFYEKDPRSVLMALGAVIVTLLYFMLTRRRKVRPSTPAAPGAKKVSQVSTGTETETDSPDSPAAESKE